MEKTLGLAKSLGCIHRVHPPDDFSPETGGVYWYFIVDFESTCDNKPNSSVKSEIIEFPVVLVNARTGEIVDEFHRYVRPTENPKLSDFCKRLTGIPQEKVDASSDLAFVLGEFERWLSGKKDQLRCVFKPGSYNAAVFATWTDWDIRTCLWNECQRKHLQLPVDLLTRIDLKSVFKQWYTSMKPEVKSDFQGGLQDALEAVGLAFKGRPHSGIDDARNTAALLNCILASKT